MDAATLRPLGGSGRAIEQRLADWLSAAEPPALTVRTSGSSGDPKEVALSRAAVTASATAAVARLGGPGQWLLALPAHYVAGLQVMVRSLLAGTGPVLLDDHPDLAAALDAMQAGRRYLSLVPTQLHRMLGSPADADALTEFDAILVGGSPARVDLVEAAGRRGVRVVTTYGMSETCGGCVHDGAPLDGVSTAIDEEGRVLIAGPVLFDGYVDQPALTAEVLRDGWLRTPDLGRIGADGRLRILGRADDVVISGGVNVSLSAVERRLRDHPSIAAVTVLATPDDEWGSRVVAVVVPAAGRIPELTELRDFVGAFHPREWAPRQVVVVDALPMLESGKVDRQAVRRDVAGATRE